MWQEARARRLGRCKLPTVSLAAKPNEATMNPALANSILEEAFQQSVEELARLNHWRLYHTYDSRRSVSGFPDLVMVRGHRLVFAELKREQGKPTAEQTKWLEQLSGVQTVSTHLWRPSDWTEIEAVLRGK
jgi:hypothetical protein